MSELYRIDTEWGFPLMQYGSMWKKQRRLFHQYMGQNLVANYHPIMYEETAKLLRILSRNSEEFMEHTMTYVFSHCGRWIEGLQNVSTDSWEQ